MLASTTDELKDVFRDEVFDPEEGVSASEPDSENLWKNREIYLYMTEACDELAKVTDQLYKTLPLTVTADEPYVSLPQNVLNIRSVRLVTAARVLEPANLGDYDGGCGDDYGSPFSGSDLWTQAGTPRCYIRDMARKAVRLAPIPTAGDTLSVECTVTVGTRLQAGQPMPFLDTQDQRLVLLYMKHLAYAKQDADTLDLARSNDFKRQFDERAQARADAIGNYRRTPTPVRMNW